MRTEVRVRRFWRRAGERGLWARGLVVATVVGLIGGGGLGVLALAATDATNAAASGATGTSSAVEPSKDGVTKNSINIVFPVIDLSAAGSAVGLSDPTEKEKDPQGVKMYVKEINDAGGINGRKINARIVKFNPLDEADMRSKCKDWTTSHDVFAVVDTGKWADDNQLCLTQEGHVPLISSWTTVTDWTQKGAPYLWWIGPDQADVVLNLVPWGLKEGLLSKDKKFAVISGDRAGDKLAVNDYLLPALRAQGLTPTLVDTITASVDDPSTAQSQAKSAVSRLKSEGVETVIPLLPANSFRSYLASAKAQDYSPKLMLSDYEQTVNVALGLAEFQFPTLLTGQLGTTVFTLSSEDDDRPDGETKLAGTGYTPAAKSCWETYKKYNPKLLATSPYIEAQGPDMRWCDAIRFAAAAIKAAGPNLNRRTFIQALGVIKNFDSPLSDGYSFSPTDHSGPTQFRTVKPVKNGNTADTNVCPPRRPTSDDANPFHGSCWLLVEDWQPLEGS
jgi:ABC-type branched-subunit amino acid transport system substrate-binding protein